jgi:hypothetical protein
MIDGSSHQLCHLEKEKKVSENEILIERKMKWFNILLLNKKAPNLFRIRSLLKVPLAGLEPAARVLGNRCVNLPKKLFILYLYIVNYTTVSPIVSLKKVFL